jgi:glycosyltransferase involved in cell wall biosynthesis
LSIKLLILTQYFPPEVGAPQNRLFELALRLQKSGVDVTVLTAMPNYPQMEIQEAYRGKKYVYEEMNGLKVHRSSIYVSKDRSIISRLRNYFSFVYSSARCGVKHIGAVDVIFCESPPLFLGYSALKLKRKKKAKLIFNVSDLWPESAEKLGVVTNKFLLKLAYNLEEKLYRNSVLVTGQTQGICKDISYRFPNKKTYWLPNGVDLNYYDPANTPKNDWRQRNGFSETDLIFLYAGIIGIAQGLEVILNAAKEVKDKPNLKFVLLGSGPEKEKLQQIKKEEGLNNVFFMDAVTKKEMPGILKSVNAVIVPLKKLDIFKGAIPSKLFESLAMKLPVLLGVDGEARDLFIEQGKCGLYFEPENAKQLAEGILKLSADPSLAKQLGENGRNYVNANFNRDNIANKFMEQLNQL